jgi:hypothetical protein
MTYIQRINYRPSLEELKPKDQRFLEEHFDAYGAELYFEGETVRWEHIEEVEVAAAPRLAGPAGWVVKMFFLRNEQRYHLGIFYGSKEIVLPNITWDVAGYVLKNIAYYTSQPVEYKGPEGLVDLSEI